MKELPHVSQKKNCFVIFEVFYCFKLHIRQVKGNPITNNNSSITQHCIYTVSTYCTYSILAQKIILHKTIYFLLCTRKPLTFTATLLKNTSQLISALLCLARFSVPIFLSISGLLCLLTRCVKIQFKYIHMYNLCAISFFCTHVYAKRTIKFTLT